MSETVTYLPPRIKRMVLIEKTSQSAKSKSFFLNYIQGLEVKIDKKRYTDTVFYFKNGCCLFEYNEKNGYIYCKYDGFWSVFEREYHMNHQQIKAFIKNGVEEHFKFKVTTPPLRVSSFLPYGVEEHFRIKVTTPMVELSYLLPKVEEHFKIKVTTPSSSFSMPLNRWKNILNLRKK